MEEWQVRPPDEYSPHSMVVNLPGELGNWTIRCTERKSGAKRGETPRWYGWNDELQIANLIAQSPVLLESLEAALAKMREYIDEHDGHDPFGFACGRCDGALPIPHSWACIAESAIRRARRK